MSDAVSKVTSGLKVGIVGGSIAGCTTAIELVRLGCDVTLYERTGEELKDRGAGIGVPPSVIDTFIRRDLVDADSRVGKLKHDERDYILLEEVNLRPQISYLAKVRCPTNFSLSDQAKKERDDKLKFVGRTEA